MLAPQSRPKQLAEVAHLGDRFRRELLGQFPGTGFDEFLEGKGGDRAGCQGRGHWVRHTWW
jgi:hypothetical protein